MFSLSPSFKKKVTLLVNGKQNNKKTNKQTKNCVLNKVAPAKQKRSPGFVWKEVVQKILAVDKTGQSLVKLATFYFANNGNAS